MVTAEWLQRFGLYQLINRYTFRLPESDDLTVQTVDYALQHIQDDKLNRFIMSVKQWVSRTNSKGIVAKAGRYGGTYAYKDIAFEFASWVSPQFKSTRLSSASAHICKCFR